MAQEFNHITLLGLGLIGSSLAQVIARKKLASHISAFDNSERALDYAMNNGFIHSKHKSPHDAVNNADLIIFATPPGTFSEIAKDISSSLKKDSVIMDVASVKRHARSSIKPSLPEHALYVPAHPIAGSEKTGVEAGNAELFSGKRVILTPEESELLGDPVTRIRILWEKIGAKVEFMPAPLHDLIYAYVSHLPQVMAFAIAPLVNQSRQDKNYRRFTRLTQSNPKLWVDICLTNPDYICNAIDDLISFLGQMHGELKNNRQNSNGDDISLLFGQLVATCLVATSSLLLEQANVSPLRYAGSGFSDMTILATEDPRKMLADISENNAQMAALLEVTLERLQKIRNAIKANHPEELMHLFTCA